MYHHDIVFCCLERPPLYYAIEFKIPELVSCLLPLPEAVDSLFNGTSALYVAARCGALESARTLIERGASIDLKSSVQAKQMTALHFAAEGGHAKVVKLFLANGASIHATTESESTPFYRAARSGSLKTLKVLYEAGSDLNAFTWDRFTPLFESVVHRRKNIAAQLLQWGADPTIARQNGQTALRLYAMRGIGRSVNLTRATNRQCSRRRHRDISLQFEPKKNPPQRFPFYSTWGGFFFLSATTSSKHVTLARARVSTKIRCSRGTFIKIESRFYGRWYTC